MVMRVSLTVQHGARFQKRNSILIFSVFFLKFETCLTLHSFCLFQKQVQLPQNTKRCRMVVLSQKSRFQGGSVAQQAGCLEPIAVYSRCCLDFYTRMQFTFFWSTSQNHWKITGKFCVIFLEFDDHPNLKFLTKFGDGRKRPGKRYTSLWFAPWCVHGMSCGWPRCCWPERRLRSTGGITFLALTSSRIIK